MTVYIAAASFEDRCLALPKRLGSAGQGDAFIMLDFSGYDDVAPYVFNRSEMRRELQSKGYRIDHIPCRGAAPLAVAARIEKAITQPGGTRVVFDVSASPRNYIFAISKQLADLGVPTTFNYNRPREYGNELSRGVRFIQPIPGFEGDTKAVGPTILALLLGFEGYKALYAWERIGPNKVIALLGQPPYEEHLLEISKRNNKELIGQGDSVKLDYIHTSDAIAAKRKLQHLYREEVKSHPDHAFILCPLGTKLQSLACFAFAYQNPSVVVTYVSSLKYFTEHYSRGYDETHIEVTLEELLAA